MDDLHFFFILFVQPACGELDIVVTTSVQCICVRAFCMHLSGFFQAITCAILHGFLNNLSQMFSLRNRSVI